MEADAEIERELNKYPSHFDIYDKINKLDKAYLAKRIDDQEKELNILNTTREKCRALNAISFLYFIIGDTDSAFDFNKQTLDLEPDNVIGISNHARYQYDQQEQIATVNQDCQRLSEICKEPYKVIIAKSEIAFIFNIFGTMFGKDVQRLFDELLTECEMLNCGELKDTQDFEENICLWKFTSAIACKRSLNAANVYHGVELDLSKTKYKYISKLCRDIIANEHHSYVCKLYSARSFLLLGELAHDVKKRKHEFPNGIKDALPENGKHLYLNTEDYFEKALSLGGNCVFVLQRCGVHFRYVKKIDQSIEVLEKAISIKPTGLNHHHLALALKNKLKSNPILKGHLPDNDYAFKRYIKCPPLRETIQTIDPEIHKEQLKVIEDHLDKAFEISMNPQALYDKGLLKEQTGQIEEAIKVFKRLFKNKKLPCSSLIIANAYEQAALCLDHLLLTSKSPNPISDEEDMKTYLKRSLEIACNLSKNVPAFTDCWSSASTLEKFLDGKKKTKNVLKDQAFLYKCINNNVSLLSVLTELLSLAENEEERVDIVLKTIQAHAKAKEFDDAVAAFDLITRLPTWQKRVDKEVYIRVHIEGALDAYRKGDANIAELRFKNAFNFNKSMSANKLGDSIEGSHQSDDDSEQYQIFILCETSDEVNGMKLCEVLNKVGVKTTINDHGVRPGNLKLKGLSDIMERSSHFFVLYGNSMELEHRFCMMDEIICSRNHGNVNILIPDKDQQLELSGIFTGYNKYKFDFDYDQLLGDNDMLLKLLTRLAVGSD